jgi:precorrin isomerase
MDIDETDVKEGEAMAESVRRVIMASGDEKLVKLIRVLPEESWARLKRLMNEEL